MFYIKHLLNRIKRVQKDVEAKLESKETNGKPKTKKDVIESVLWKEVLIEISKFLVPLLIVPFLLTISSPFVRKYTEEGSFKRNFPLNIFIYFGIPFFFFELGRIVDKISWRNRFKSGEFESSESLEELEKREKETETRSLYWSHSVWGLNGLLLGLMAPQLIRESIWPSDLVQANPNQMIARICN